ncbi:LiaF transmembrane domain-containing protein [Piscinibacter sakaiensis]|uniref:LiaF transmembrane domain-containing protein n=1 Tax=Piscinibacter sakaiensis TaxID=1547922 RepID=UPI003AB060CB
MNSKSLFAPLLLIALGIFFLLSNLGMLPQIGPLIARWWPLILIVIGVGLLLKRR